MMTVIMIVGIVFGAALILAVAAVIGVALVITRSMDESREWTDA